MKLILTLLVRDEADIIASHLRYHLDAGVDFIIATDNGSVDGTTALLKDFERQGSLEYLYEPPADFSQHAWVTRMARRARTEYHADWVINADADEFFVAEGGDLKAALQRVPEAVSVVRSPDVRFVPFERPCRYPPPVEMIYCRQETLTHKVMHRGAEDVVVTQGNHTAESHTFAQPPLDFPEIEVFHYSVRSLPQFVTKVRNGGSGYALNTHLPREQGWHKRRWYTLLQAGQLEEEYRQLFYPAPRLAEALTSGELVENRTLSDHLQQHA